jgi:hypothetical protein
MTHAVVRDLRGPVSVMLGAVALLSACGSSAAPTSSTAHTATPPKASTASRSACALMTVGEAEAIFHGPVLPLTFCNQVPGDKSEGLYLSSGSQHAQILLVVSWSRTDRTAFATQVGTSASSSPEKVTVSGLPAYWQSRPSATGGGPTSPQVLTLTSSNHGYVVALETQNLTQPQVQQAMTLVLGRL